MKAGAPACGRRLPEVACSASGIFIPHNGIRAGAPHGTTLGTAQQAGMLAAILQATAKLFRWCPARSMYALFRGHEARLGNLEISNRCGLPRSTVSRLTHTLTRIGQLVYLPRDRNTASARVRWR